MLRTEPGPDMTCFRHSQRDLLISVPDDSFSILTVCTGNVCRSPAVERLLASKLGPTVSVASAGTHALVGHPISEPMAVLLRNSGIEEHPLRGSPPVGADAEGSRSGPSADSRPAQSGRGAVARRRTAYVHSSRVRTAAQAGSIPRLCRPVLPPSGLRAAIPLAAAERGRERTSPDDDDVIDPFRLSEQVYAQSFGQIASAVDAIVTILL